MFWQLDAKHVVVITDKEADTEGVSGKYVLLEFYSIINSHLRTRQNPQKSSVEELNLAKL